MNIAVGVHLVAYLQDRDFEPTLAATATGMVGAMQVVGRIVLSLLGDRARCWSRRRWCSRSSRSRSWSCCWCRRRRRLRLHRPVRHDEGRADADSSVAGGGAVRPARYATMAGALAAFVIGATALAPISAGRGLRRAAQLRSTVLGVRRALGDPGRGGAARTPLGEARLPDEARHRQLGSPAPAPGTRAPPPGSGLGAVRRAHHRADAAPTGAHRSRGQRRPRRGRALAGVTAWRSVVVLIVQSSGPRSGRS